MPEPRDPRRTKRLLTSFGPVLFEALEDHKVMITPEVDENTDKEWGIILDRRPWNLDATGGTIQIDSWYKDYSQRKKIEDALVTSAIVFLTSPDAQSAIILDKAKQKMRIAQSQVRILERKLEDAAKQLHKAQDELKEVWWAEPFEEKD